MQAKTIGHFFSKINILGAYQILGGVLGILYTSRLLLNFAKSSWHFVISGFAIALYIYSIHSGVTIFKNLKFGFKQSWINQALQLVNFSVAGYAFKYSSGLYFSIGMDLTKDFELKFYFGTSNWHIIINKNPDLHMINLNIVALFLLIFIHQQIRKLREQELEKRFLQST